MMKRKCLPNKYKPKHHYFHHLAELYAQFGPPIFVWTLGFEQYHQYFKNVSRTCGNYINLLYTFCRAHQLMQAYQSTGVLFPSNAVYSAAFPLVLDSFCPDDRTFLESCNFSSNALVVKKSLNFSDIIYKVNSYVLLGKEDGNISVGKVKYIIHDSEIFCLVVSKYKSEYWEEYGTHKISKENQLAKVRLQHGHENPLPHGVYSFLGKKCISLKHVFIECWLV